jgi:autotransporter-associated beta strand protein
MIVASVFLEVAAPAQTTYTWTNLVSGNASGSWATAANWQGGSLASGSGNTADFSTLNITNNSTVTLDGAQTIGSLIFGATVSSGTNNWILSTGTAGSTLTLATSSGQPTLNAANGSNTIAAVLVNNAVPSGLTKTGNGLIRLSSANLMTNVINNINGGVLLAANNNALGYVTSGVVGTNNVASGATLYVPVGQQIANQRMFISGTGQGGTNGAFRIDAGTGSQQNTRWSYALNSIANPAFVLNGDATIRVDGSGYTTQAGALVGAVTNNTSGLAYTLTIAGTGEFRIDPGAEIAVANINIAGGILGLNGNGPANITLTQAVTVASGAAIATRRNHTYNASESYLTLNGIFDLNYNSGAVANNSGNTWYQKVGSLQGSGFITNSSLAPQTLYVVSATSNSIFSGTVNPGANGPITLRKEGQNTMMWLGGSSTFSGTNIVAGGIQYINGAWNPTNGGFQVSAQSGATTATLAGKGSTVSPVVLGSGGFISAGDPTAGNGTLSVNTITASSSGVGGVIVSNANLTVSGNIGTVGSMIGTLYATNGTLTIPLSAIGASIFAGTVTVDGQLAINFSIANPAVGQFPLIAYSSLGGLAGGGTNGITLMAPAGTTAYLSNNIATATLDVVVTAVPALKWNGNVNGNWNIAGTANWLNGATSSTYTETAGAGPFVNFDDSAAGTTTVNVTTSVTPKGSTVNNTSKDYTFTGNGAILGTGGLLKQGSGTLTLANTNGFSGSVNISAGTVVVGGGGTAGSLGTGSVINSGTLVFNRSDSVTLGNVITCPGSLVKSNSGSVTLTGVSDVGGNIAANGGTLALAPAGTITVAGDVTGTGAFGINSAGKVKLSSGNIAYSGGSVIQGGGTLEFDNAFPPAGNVTDNGTLAFGVGGTFSDNISGTGGIMLLNGSAVTLAGINSYSGPTTVLGGGSVIADAANYPVASMLILGSTNGLADIGSATFNSGDPVLGGLVAGGNNTAGDAIYLGGSNQKITVNGNVVVGNTPSGASVYLPLSGSGVSLTVNTNGGIIQIGLGNTGSGINPDNILVDFSGIDNFTANLGATGMLNMGTTDGNPGPPSGATVVNQFKLANISNSITAGTLMVGAGGRQLVPELMLGPGTNIINVNTNYAGGGGRDGSYIHFAGGTGGLRLRAADGISPAIFNVGVNPATGTGASITNSVDFTGHPVDLLLSSLLIGDYNNAGYYQNTFSFDTGVLNAQSTSLSILRNNNANAADSGSALNIFGGAASLGAVTLTASAAYGTLNVAGTSLATANISAPGSGVSSFNITNSTWSLTLTNGGNPAVAPVKAQNFSAAGTINLSVNGTNWVVGQFPLISYSGSIGGDGYAALNLLGLPAGVTGHLSNNVANLSVDLVVVSAPLLINTNPPVLQVLVSPSALTLGWPTNRGWLLQSNSIGLAATGSWFNYPSDGSVSATNVTLTVQPGKTNVFFRLVKP